MLFFISRLSYNFHKFYEAITFIMLKRFTGESYFEGQVWIVWVSMYLWQLSVF